MFRAINNWINKKTFHDLGTVFVENILSKGMNFILIILIARTFGPEKYGLFSFVTVSILFLSEFLNFSMENAAVRFSGKYQSKRDEIFGSYFLFKTATLVILFLIFLLFPNLIIRLINKPGIEKYLFIIFIGCTVESYQFIIVTYFQSQEKFFLRAVINAGVYLLRFVSIFILLKLSIYNIRIISLFFALSGIPFVLLFFRHLVIILRRIIVVKIHKILLKEILYYAGWLVIGSIATKIMTRLDFYVVTSMFSFKEAGLYNSAFQLIFPLTIFQFVFTAVFLPKVSKYKTSSQIKRYIKMVTRLGIIISISVFLILPFCKNIILFLFGGKYFEASGIFRILLVSYLFTIWNVMFSLVLYSLGRVKYAALGAYIQLIVFSVFAINFIPSMGMFGAAWGRFVSDVIYLAFVIFYLRKSILSLELEEGKLNI